MVWLRQCVRFYAPSNVHKKRNFIPVITGISRSSRGYTFPLSCGETAAFYRRVLRSTVPFLLFLICGHSPPDFFLNPIVRMKHICACRCHTGDPAGCASCKPSERKKTKKNKNSGRFTKKTNKNKIKPGSDGDQAQSLYEVSYYFGSGAWQKKMAGGDVNFV